MAIDLVVDNVKTRVRKEAPVAIKATPAAGESVDSVTVSGLPAGARFTVGTEKAGGTWEILAADLDKAALVFDERQQKPVELTFTAAGTSPAGAISATAKAFVEVLAPAWKYTSGITAALLVLFTVLLFVVWRSLYSDAQDVLSKDWDADWEQPADVMLGSGPVTFWYDPVEKKLHHRGAINSELKLQLLNLAYPIPMPAEPVQDESAPAVPESSSPVDLFKDPRVASYRAAVDSLAYKSNGNTGKYFLYLLALAGLSGMLGTQIRAFDAFIYRSTKKEDLDIGVWWPWYALRPILGFLLGLMAVLLVEARLFVPTTETTPSGTAWWMALAMIVGFAANDFASRLRLIGQALFGQEK